MLNHTISKHVKTCFVRCNHVYQFVHKQVHLETRSFGKIQITTLQPPNGRCWQHRNIYWNYIHLFGEYIDELLPWIWLLNDVKFR